MDINNRRALKDAAHRSLAAAAYDPKKLIFLHTGAALLLSLLLTALDFVLAGRIAATGGLSGMGLRSILSTTQSVLRIANLVVLPFWEIGYSHALLRLAREEEAAPASLLEGFRRFVPVLCATLLQFAIYLGLAIACCTLAAQIFLVTPLAAPLYEILESLVAESPTLTTSLVLDDATMNAVMGAYMPMLIIFLVLYCLISLPIAYQYRMVGFCLMDESRPGGLAALRASRQMMRRNRFSLFKLDLSFWWFYLLQTLLTVICYGDLLLPALGISLPFSAEVSYFLFYIISLLAQLVLYTLFRNRVELTYAHAYESLRQPQAQPIIPVVPKNQPWDYE